MLSPLQSRIFLSYQRQDKDAVSELYKRLKQKGYAPWIDTTDLLPGQNWQEVIPEVIKDSAVFIACLSNRSAASEGFIQRELRIALTKSADKPSGSIYIIPLRLDDCAIPRLRQNEYGISLQDCQLGELLRERWL